MITPTRVLKQTPVGVVSDNTYQINTVFFGQNSFNEVLNVVALTIICHVMMVLLYAQLLQHSYLMDNLDVCCIIDYSPLRH